MSRTCIHVDNTSGFEKGNIVTISCGENYGFWQLLWRWIIRKGIKRDKYYKVVNVTSDTTMTLEE